MTTTPTSPQIRAVPVKPHRKSSHRRRLRWTALSFPLLSLHWLGATALALHYWRTGPLATADYAVSSIGVVLAIFYLWVGYAVFRRRGYIWNTAVACAAIWVVGFPTGTIVSALALINLVDLKHSFTK